MNDLFSNSTQKKTNKYTAEDIEVLEGLEPVRRRPGMYIGGIDESGLHHLAVEVLDNAMDEAVAGHATRIEISLKADGSLTIEDNGRGIPTDPHPKFKSKSALEIILTTLHAGAKFSNKTYETASGLHGVGVSVVNALSERLEVEVAREKKIWSHSFKRGKPVGKLKTKGAAHNRRGTRISFWPDPEIFGVNVKFKPETLFEMARSKAYLFRGVEIRWKCDSKLLKNKNIPENKKFHYPNGLIDHLNFILEEREVISSDPFSGGVSFTKNTGRVEWAISWPTTGDGVVTSYVNTVMTPNGGTHELGLRSALTKSLKDFGDRIKERRSSNIIPEDVMGSTTVVLSVFLPEPQFHGQTKDKLGNIDVTKKVENVIKDHFDQWLANSPAVANDLLEHIIDSTESRLRRKQEKSIARKNATRRLRLPGKLSDCSRSESNGTELLLVEGDSAGGTAKQARNRETQAILPLKGKILNVASAAAGKINSNNEISDIMLALGCSPGTNFKEKDLRYEKIIILTDADVDGAHIASLILTFFYREIPDLIRLGHLFIALPPLYRLTQGDICFYARDDIHKNELIKQKFNSRNKVEISRFKGLGEMPASQLKMTTMDPKNRTLLKVTISQKRESQTSSLVEQLMGKNPELRLQYIREHAVEAKNLDI